MSRPVGRPRKLEGRWEQLSVALPGATVEQLRQIVGRDYLQNRMGPSGRPSIAHVVREAVEDYLERKASA